MLTQPNSFVILQVDDIPPDQHALVPSFMGGSGKRIHPFPFADQNLPGVLSSLEISFKPTMAYALF